MPWNMEDHWEGVEVALGYLPGESGEILSPNRETLSAVSYVWHQLDSQGGWKLDWKEARVSIVF